MAAPLALPALVESRFTAAKASGSLTFSSTELSIIRTSSGIPFQLRYCPALAKKPQPSTATSSKKPNPFENPQAELLVTELPERCPSHRLVLNKYPVIANHSILATQSYKKQTALLEQEDLEVTYAYLKSWEQAEIEGNKRGLFAFFNSGESSGASQAHRHVQFLPVEQLGVDSNGQQWEVLIDRIVSSSEATVTGSSGLLSLPQLPFTHFVSRIPPQPTPCQLQDVYLDLLKAAENAVKSFVHDDPSSAGLYQPRGDAAPISYNLAMTTSAMAICPRRSEAYPVRVGNGSTVDPVALNGTLLAGTLMVKAHEDWDALRVDPTKLDLLLESTGLPRTQSVHL